MTNPSIAATLREMAQDRRRKCPAKGACRDERDDELCVYCDEAEDLEAGAQAWEIVQRLVDRPPGDNLRCQFCGETSLFTDDDQIPHDANCLWQQARSLLAGSLQQENEENKEKT